MVNIHSGGSYDLIGGREAEFAINKERSGGRKWKMLSCLLKHSKIGILKYKIFAKYFLTGEGAAASPGSATDPRPTSVVNTSHIQLSF